MFDIVTRLINSPANQEWVDYHVNTIRAALTNGVVLGVKKMKEVSKRNQLVSERSERSDSSDCAITNN